MSGDDLSARARRGDPETSHAAAAGVKDLRLSQSRVRWVLRYVGPLTDEGIWPHVSNWMSQSGARTRRAELVDLGLVEDSGVRNKTHCGRKSIVWQIKKPEIKL